MRPVWIEEGDVTLLEMNNETFNICVINLQLFLLLLLLLCLITPSFLERVNGPLENKTHQLFKLMHSNFYYSHHSSGFRGVVDLSTH